MCIRDRDIALTTTKNTLSSYLSEEYIKRNFSDETKKDVENMVNEFIDILDVYKRQIQHVEQVGIYSFISDFGEQAVVYVMRNGVNRDYFGFREYFFRF